MLFRIFYEFINDFRLDYLYQMNSQHDITTRMKNLILIFGLLITISGSGQEVKKGNWNVDLDFLKVELPKKHKDFYSVKSEKDFQLGIDKISEQIDELTNFDIAVKLQQLVAGFGDSHTRISWNKYLDREKMLPLHLYWFNDGIFILHTTKKNQKLVGQKITMINDKPIKSVVDSLSTLITLDNDALVKSVMPHFLISTQLLKYFGIVNNEGVKLKLENQQGESWVYNIQPAHLDRKNRVTFQFDSLALCHRNERAYFWDEYVAKDRIYYLQYNKCRSQEIARKQGHRQTAKKLPSFSKFKNRVLKTIKDKPIDKLIFDMRFNGGGSSIQGTEFIEKLSQVKEINQKGKLFVVVGRKTFSSAILNAMDFEKMTDAIFVGEETGGKPNHFGEVRSFKLPNSGLEVNYSTKYFKKSDKYINTFAPDYIIKESFIDLKKGIDPVYDWIKKQ